MWQRIAYMMSCMMCTPTSRGAAGGKIPSSQFPHSKQEPPSRVRLQWPSHRNGSCDPEWVVGELSARCNTASTAARARASTDVRCGDLGRERARASSSVALRPFAFTNLTTRVVTHLKLPIMHQGQPDCAHVASVRARTGQHNTRVHSPPKLHTAQRYTEEIL